MEQLGIPEYLLEKEWENRDLTTNRYLFGESKVPNYKILRQFSGKNLDKRSDVDNFQEKLAIRKEQLVSHQKQLDQELTKLHEKHENWLINKQETDDKRLKFITIH